MEKSAKPCASLLFCEETMVQTIEAVFDGHVLRPDAPLPIEANTRVRVTVETLTQEETPARSFLQTARSLKLEGPADWSANLDEYLYGEGDAPAR
jgi:hypothetical protein